MAKGHQTLILLTLIGGCASHGMGTFGERAKQCLATGDAACNSGNYNAGVDQFTQALQLNPNYAEAFLKRGAARIERLDSPQGDGKNYVKETEAAIEDFGQAIAIYPMYFEAYFNRALAYASLGRYKPAISDLVNFCLKLQPQDRDSHLWAAKVYDSGYEDQGKMAARHLEQYLQLGGTDPWARKRFDEFKAATEKATLEQNDEKDATAMYEQARKLVLQGKQDESLKLLEELVKKYPHTKVAKEKVIPFLFDALKGTPPKKDEKK